VRHRAALFALAVLAAAAGPAHAAEPIPRAVDRILDRAEFRSALWGVEVRSLRSGRLLYARNADKSFRPASTLKLLTTAAALDLLGPEARFPTTVESGGRLDRFGRVLGDLYLVGSGDPNLSGRLLGGDPLAPLQELAAALQAAGVRKVEGRVVGHEGAFVGERRGADWSWEDLVWSYGVEVSALSFNDNTAELRLLSGERFGEPAQVERSPASAYYSVSSTVTTGAPGAKKADLRLERDLGTMRFRLSGVLPLGDLWQARVAVEDPARYAATVFTEVLAAKGIGVTGEVATSSAPLPEPRRTLARHDSPPLSEALRVVNKDSLNLHAELLLRAVGRQAGGEGSVAGGQRAMKAFLERLGLGSAWRIEDGSGLSRADLATPASLVGLLVAMDRHPHAAVFRDSLAVAGVDGTLKNRLKGAPTEGRVLAKTGTLRTTNTLAGYLTTRSGERLAFAVVLNNHALDGREATDAIDDVCRVLANR
jgi:D-alanyl-D-alanine carboxypeptidase/D-alanyl-D-alanine-endopeptidase (penicillin-binding protein 4)